MKKSHANAIWQKTSSDGATESERYLSKLARKAFLNFWSYSNPYTDEGGGKELCDFLVVFGNDIIIFSDKHCKYPAAENHNTSWKRWYKTAVNKSSRQLVGASSFIERFPERIYLDAECKYPLPIPLPSASKRKIHLVAVTRGSAKASEKYWGNGSSSSLVINTMINEREHENHPFMVGWPIKNRRFVHIFDELTLDVLLDELDTAPDFIEYLTKKEELLSVKGRDFIIPGEEDLFADYFLHPLEKYLGFSFSPIPPNETLITFEEGAWKKISKSNAYRLWKSSKEISYQWDGLIEHQTSHIVNKTADVFACDSYRLEDVQVHEMVLRAMAEERRSVRQILAEAHKDALTRDHPGDRIAKTIVIPNRPSRAYVLMSLKATSNQNYEEYRAVRRASLICYCRAARLRIGGIKEVIGIASEQLSSATLTQDFAFVKFDAELTCEEKKQEVSSLRDAGIWKNDWKCI
jgi:hypothetical protein